MDLGFCSLEYLTDSVNYCGGIPPFPPQNIPCVPLKGDKKTIFRSCSNQKLWLLLKPHFSPQTSTQVKTKRIKEKLETPWKGNGETWFCWIVLLLVLSVSLCPGREWKEGGSNSKLLSPDSQGDWNLPPWPHSSPVSIGMSQGIDGIYSIAPPNDSCWLSGQQIYPWFYPLGLAPDMEQLWDIVCSAELLGTKSRGRN